MEIAPQIRPDPPSPGGLSGFISPSRTEQDASTGTSGTVTAPCCWGSEISLPQGVRLSLQLGTSHVLLEVTVPSLGFSWGQTSGQVACCKSCCGWRSSIVLPPG